ncbi:saccharopine dehydrogenase NADP-binding domain-containing protein, partial [Myxococcota bacterium]|nr:saccharopine dehydrogenase NADP-binding domain-containing protein [Myxococcota bacterium]
MPSPKTAKDRKTVACLGAAGDMGKTLARHLSRSAGIGNLVLADLDGHAAARAAAALVGTATCDVTSEKVDVLNEGNLRKLLGRVDFVVNAAGPFFRLGVPTLRAAIETRTPYLDICDDPEPTIEMMALDVAARAGGVAA